MSITRMGERSRPRNPRPAERWEGQSSVGSFPWVGADTHVIDIALKINELILKCVQAVIEWGVFAVAVVQGGA